MIIRWPFVLALENSDIYKESVRLGQYININTQSQDKVLALTQDPDVGFDGMFIAFYADRKISIINDHSATTEVFTKVFRYLPGGKIIESLPN